MWYPSLLIGALQGRTITDILLPMPKLGRPCGQQKCQPLWLLRTMDHGPSLGLPLIRDTPLSLPWVTRTMAHRMSALTQQRGQPHFLGHSLIPREQYHELQHHPLTVHNGTLCSNNLCCGCSVCTPPSWRIFSWRSFFFVPLSGLRWVHPCPSDVFQ